MLRSMAEGSSSEAPSGTVDFRAYVTEEGIAALEEIADRLGLNPSDALHYALAKGREAARTQRMAPISKMGRPPGQTQLERT
jgi:DNA primase